MRKTLYKRMMVEMRAVRKLYAILPLFLLLLCFFGCAQRGETPQAFHDDGSGDFPDARPAAVSEETKEACVRYAEDMGYVAGAWKRTLLLGERLVPNVFCEDAADESLVSEDDYLVIFEGVRCVVDAETERVLGRIPYV